LEDRQTIMWYRTAFRLDGKSEAKRLVLFFTEVDGTATVYVNGRKVGGCQDRRTPFSVDVSESMTRGKNVVAVRVDHSKITDLFLGGILRPVLLVSVDGKTAGGGA
jgi:beta-galactosidase/beta-glucuronidase